MKISEEQFLLKIDCNFPYNDFVRGKNIIDEAITISFTAVCKVVEELVRIPYGVNTNRNINKQLLDYLFQNYSKKELYIIQQTCYKMNNGDENLLEEGMHLMSQLKNFRENNILLNIVYFSVDDRDGILDKFYQKIIDDWGVNN